MSSGVTFVKATIYNAKSGLKDTGYLLLEYLKSNPAYDLNWRGDVKKKDNSIVGKDQKRTFDIVENYLKRLLFNNFKENHKLRPYAETLQNLASAKYMMVNITGGIANVTTGLVNIMGENLAKQFVKSKSFFKAEKEYISNIPSIINSIYKEEATSETAAILKYFDIIDFTEFTERRPDETVSEYTKRVRESLYSLQNGGEHFMQNTVLLAMLDDYRVWQDKTTGKWTVGNVNDYQNNLEEIALLNAIKDNADLQRLWISFKQQINLDKNELKDYDQFRKNPVATFLKTKVDSEYRKDLINKYTEIKKELLKTRLANFEKLNTVRSYLKYDGKTVTYDKDSPFANIFGQFKDIVISVNKLHPANASIPISLTLFGI